MRNRRIKRMMPNTVTIERRSETPDAYGGVTGKWEKMDWLIECRIYMVLGASVITFEGTEFNISHRFMCLDGEDIEEGDKLMNQDSAEKYILVRLTKIYDKKNVHHLEGMLSRINE